MTKKMLQISVIIPTYHRAQYLLQTVSEVLAQKHPAVKEIIIIDQTPTSAIPESFLDEIKRLEAMDKIRYFHRKHANLPAARNTAILLAKGDVLLMLDDDVLLPEQFIEEHLKCYEKDKTIIGVAGLPYNRGLNTPYENINKINKLNFREYTFPPFKEKKFVAKWTKTMVGANHSFLREEGIKTGGYDEQFVGVSFYEDSDFSMRLKKTYPDCSICFNPLAYNIHLRAKGGVRVTTESSWSEKQLLIGPFIYGWRHLNGLALGKHFFQLIRVGPLRKNNVIKFWRQPYVWFVYFQLLITSKHKSKRIQAI